MQELTCKTARRWMQAPHELSLLGGRQLDRHVLSCTKCGARWQAQLETNRLIQMSLERSVGELSVRAATRELLRASGSARRLWRFRLPHIPRPAWLAMPVGAILVALAVIASDLNPRLGGVPAVQGATWHVVRPNIAYPMAVDPTRSNHLLAGAWGQVYESWNAGDSWHALGRLPSDLVVRSVAVDSTNPRRYLVAVKSSVFVSEDAGGHWASTANRLPGAENMFLIQAPRPANEWYVGPSVLWKSSDGGRHWQQDGLGQVFAPNGIQALSFAPSGDLYTGIWTGGVAVSHNGGRTWQRRAVGLAKKVMDVSATGRSLWAATTNGIYSSSDAGLHWKRRGPHARFWTTSILNGGNYLLAGGNGGIYRSDDAGRHWHASTHGLPFYSYVYNLIPDPRNPHRVYACLNTDGIFRSDDDGRTWTVVDSGIPLTGTEHAPRSVLFRNHGILWITGASGADPGNLTVDSQVSVAATAPDGAAVAYVTGTPSGWATRIVNPSGSAAKTAAQGDGRPPAQLFWSPASSALAVPLLDHVYLWNARSGERTLQVAIGEQLLGWASDGRTLLFWRGSTGQVVRRSQRTGAQTGIVPGQYPTWPHMAPDSRHVALLSNGYLYTGSWDRVLQPRGAVPGNCSIGPWSDDSTRLLTICQGTVQERTLDGRILAHTRISGGAFWVPGSDTDLLYFRKGLRRWSPGHSSALIVANARSAQPRLTPPGSQRS